MSDKSAIEWLAGGSSWNILGGCTKCSIGCEHCFAERMTHRLGHNPATPQYAGLTGADGHWTGEVRLFPGKSQEPRGWKKPRRVFVQSMGDLFHEKVPAGWITHVLDTIQACPQHTFIMLTKRPENMRKALYGKWDRGNGKTWQYMSEDHVIPNLWFGVTVCNQEEADVKIPLLLQIPAAVRWVSIEPCLGPIDISEWLFDYHCSNCGRYFMNNNLDSDDDDYYYCCPSCKSGDFMDARQYEETRIDWVVVGAETGPGKRPMNLDWARNLRDQCARAGTKFFFKKDSAGSRLLDGREWNEYPEVSR